MNRISENRQEPFSVFLVNATRVTGKTPSSPPMVGKVYDGRERTGYQTLGHNNFFPCHITTLSIFWPTFVETALSEKAVL